MSGYFIQWKYGLVAAKCVCYTYNYYMTLFKIQNQVNFFAFTDFFFLLQLGNTLVFLLYLVAKHPDVQEKIYEEVSRLAPAGMPITAEHLHNATYLHACISEAHR